MDIKTTTQDCYVNLMMLKLDLQQYKLVVNAIKRQVDYYRNRVYNLTDENENMQSVLKHHYKVYNDLYNSIIVDYEDIVKSEE